MAAFMMHPERGIVEINEDGAIVGNVKPEPVVASAPRDKLSTVATQVQTKSITAKASTAELSPRDVIRLAKRRKKEIDAELKSVRSKLKNLEREKLQIDALVKAADSAHLAVVRPINNKRTG